jgi:hypothetical protein
LPHIWELLALRQACPAFSHRKVDYRWVGNFLRVTGNSDEVSRTVDLFGEKKNSSLSKGGEIDRRRLA